MYFNIRAIPVLFLFVPSIPSKLHPHCHLSVYLSAPPLLTRSLHLLTSATGLSCRPLVFLLPRPGTTGSPGSHTHTHTHPQTAFTFLIWHPSGKGRFCVLCMFVDEHSSSGRLIGQGFLPLLIRYFIHYFLSLSPLAVMFLH